MSRNSIINIKDKQFKLIFKEYLLNDQFSDDIMRFIYMIADSKDEENFISFFRDYSKIKNKNNSLISQSFKESRILRNLEASRIERIKICEAKISSLSYQLEKER